MGKKLSVELGIRLQEQLAELVETYGVENVKNTVGQFADELENTTKPQEENNKTPQTNYQTETSGQPAQSQKPSLPPNIRDIEGFEVVVADFAAKGKVDQATYKGIQGFIQNAKMIMSGQYKQVDESFIMNLTSMGDLVKVITPEEDWIKYNAEIVRTKLKRKLRLAGYDFLDSEVEVGTAFDKERHNVVGKDTVTNPAMDNRVLKVMNEGLIINRKLHINANVIIGVYDPRKV